MKGVDELAGRELDAAVAEEVFGWFNCDPHEEHRTYEFNDHPPPAVLRGVGECEVEFTGGPRKGGTFTLRDRIPDYSTDISAAWEVVEKMWQVQIDSRDDDGDWCVVVWPAEGVPDVLALARTAPEAICRAALKAVRAGSECAT